MPTYYITKYCMTSGIGKVEAPDPDEGGYVAAKFPEGAMFKNYFKLGRDAFESREDAVKAAFAARDKKVSSLNKQVQKLKNMQFS